MLLFTSFEPAELRTEQSSTVGVKYLKSYLEMAASGAEMLEADPRCQRSSTATKNEGASESGVPLASFRYIFEQVRQRR